MDHVRVLVERYFGAQDGELCLGGTPVTRLADRHGTPLFIYDSSVLDRKHALLRQTLPPEFAISYSVKANPNRALLRFFLDRGCGLEVASAGELVQVLSAGCQPEKIVFAGPGKTELELDLALGRDIGELHIESLLEAKRVNSIARRLGRPARIAVRVNPSGDAQGGAMRMGGKPAPFGIDEESLDVVLDSLLTLTYLDLRGIHLFTGTQILDYTVLLAQYRKGLEIGERVARRLQRPLHTIDFGGGLGIPYFPNDQELDMSAFKLELASLVGEVRSKPEFAGTQFMVEPGRYLVGEAGIYVARVQDIKVSRGKKFLIIDGGMHHHLAASGNLGQTIKRNYPVGVLNRLSSPSDDVVDVVGPLCTPLDVLARSVTLPKAEVGDLIGVFQSGAYARAASPLGFLSHPAPPEIWIEGGKDFLIRKRGSYEDYLQDICHLERNTEDVRVGH